MFNVPELAVYIPRWADSSLPDLEDKKYNKAHLAIYFMQIFEARL